MTVRVLLADDQVLVRTGFRSLLESAPDLEVVGEARTGREAVELTRLLRPDVVLMDIGMPELDGLAATQLISDDAGLAQVKVLILTTFEADHNVFGALRAGASGFLGKSVELDELIEAIRTVHRGDMLLSPAATKRLVARCLARPEQGGRQPVERLAALTDREREVLALVATGMTNDEIAQRLVVSPHTAKTHINRAMTKLGARDRAQLVVIAYETGLVRPPERSEPTGTDAELNAHYWQ
ncbi:two component transcriptional regulator, LuxR family [Actinobacteria bacterium OK074]|nr:two component transcriptional regulator, LuxR family [Actinobacteria bacterium OK074]